MRATQFIIKNVLGVRDVDIKLGQITKLSGANGTGKSSVIETAKALLGGGTDATLLPAGAAKGEAVLVLDDDTRIRLSLTAKGQYKTAKGPSAPSSGVQTWLDEICSARTLNPVAFLEGSDKDRIEMLIRASKIELSADDFAPFAKWGEQISTADPLDLIERTSKKIYDERTGINRSAKDKRAAASGINVALPDGDPDEVKKRSAEATEAHGEMLVKKQQELNGIERTRESVERAAAAAHQKKLDSINAHLEKEIASLKDRAQKARDVSLTDKSAAVSAANEAYRTSVAQCSAAYDKEISTAAATSSMLAEQVRQHDRAAESRVMAERMASEAASLESQSSELTAKLDQIESLKVKLMSQLPVPGMEIRAGELFHENVPFSRVNEAKQKAIAVDIAAHFAGPLGIVLIDGAECFDDANRKALEEAIVARGLQAVIATRTEDSELKVEVA